MAEEALHTYVDVINSKGEPLQVYSTHGAKSTDDFTRALSQYKVNETLPEGFKVVNPATLNWFSREVFNPVREAVQTTAPTVGRLIGEGVASTVPYGNPLNTLYGTGPAIDPMQQAPGSSLGRIGGNIGQAVAEELVSPFDNPQKFAANVGLGVGTALSQPARTAAGLFSKSLMAINAAKVAGAVGAGEILANIATGQNITGEQGVGGLITDMVLTGGLSSVQQVLSHVAVKHIPAERQKEFFDKVQEAIFTRYPQLRNNPNALNIGLESSSDVVAKTAAAGADALRGTVDDIRKNIMSQVRGIIPANMQDRNKVMRQLDRHMDDFAEAGHNVLATINDPKEFAKAERALRDKIREVGDFFDATVKGAYANDPAGYTNASATLAGTMAGNMSELRKVYDGAKTFGLINRSMSPTGGIDMMALRNNALESYTGPQGQVLETMRQQLAGGPGKSLYNLPTVSQPGSHAWGTVWDMLNMPKWASGMLNAPRRNIPTLPAQMPVDTPRMLNLGVQAVGKEAIDRAMGKEE